MAQKNRFLGKPLVGVILITVSIFLLTASLLVGLSDLCRGAGTYANVRNSVALVYSEFTYEGDLYAATGTAFAIGIPGKPVQYMVTNSHVVEDVQTYGGLLRVYFSAATNDYMVPQIVYQSLQNDKDLVVLKLPEPTEKRKALLLVPSDRVKIGQEVFAIGYPAISSDAESYTTYDSTNATVTRGIVSKRTTTTLGTYEAWQTDTPISGGNSGGPLVDSSGALVGVVVAGYGNEDMNYSIIGDELLRILTLNGFRYTLKGEYDWIWILLLLTGLITITVGTILLIVGLVKKPKPAAAPAPGPAPVRAAPQAPRKSVPVLRGLSGAYAGQRIPLNGRVVMGRDPSQCSLVFAQNTPGVSSNHCTVSYDVARGVYLLVDNGSSYGTFLGNGQKIAPHVPSVLQNGDTFYLATPENRFSVTLETL
ncbi:MAG: trypsin-like peptidase domain-containing protein [Christensenellales bacterium]|jgi:hypothetical protein